MNLLNVRIFNSKKVIFDGQARSVTSKNSAGNFDVLPFHANFITLIENADIIIRDQDNKQIKFHFDSAILYAASNLIHIYTDIPLPVF